ncbi:hypothetical protein SSX86_023873 [Deinandra increscens subsp. villosa]|uniref:Uncharacterized protein n=1 Tax=Deinandra increscens subsp. villosa TaxID=3103831 RepID=A0AAP0CI95_9ASTR
MQPPNMHARPKTNSSSLELKVRNIDGTVPMRKGNGGSSKPDVPVQTKPTVIPDIVKEQSDPATYADLDNLNLQGDTVRSVGKLDTKPTDPMISDPQNTSLEPQIPSYASTVKANVKESTPRKLNFRSMQLGTNDHGVDVVIPLETVVTHRMVYDARLSGSDSMAVMVDKGIPDEWNIELPILVPGVRDRLCSYSRQVWQLLQKRLGFPGCTMGWLAIVDELICRAGSKSFESVVGRISVAAAAYYVWKEHNDRIFRT